jgi:hypothetical protein
MLALSAAVALLFYVMCVLLIVPIVRKATATEPAIAFSFLGVLAGLALLWLTGFLLRGSERLLVFGHGSLAVGLIGGAYLLWRESGSLNGLVGMIASEMWRIAFFGAAVTFVVFGIIVVPLALLIVWRGKRAAIRSEPQSALLVPLFAMAHALADTNALADKSTLLRCLNDAADVLESGYWRTVDLANPFSRAIWRDRCRQCALRLRSLDLWIALPRRETRVDLQAEIVALIHVLVRGCLDELPKAEPSPRRRLAAFGNAVRSLLLGLVPLAAVFGAKFVGLDLSGALGGALVVAAVAWFALTVLTTLDRQAESRLSLLKDAGEALSKFKGVRS